LVKILCGYIYGVYYIRRSVEFAVVTSDEIYKQPNNIPAIVLTKSKYAYQLPAMLDNCVLFRPKKYKGSDTSLVITKSNVIQTYCDTVNSETTISKMNQISGEFLSLIMTLSGLPCRNVPRLLNSNTSVNKIYDAVCDNRILNRYNTDINYLYNNLNIESTIDPVNFSYRFNAIDLIVQNRFYMNSAESKDISHLVDLYDKNAVHHINNTYFQDNPLNIDAL
jgi:hypothetical protein